ncbi:unnamed protein product [Schistosoma curassoni]|uniref:Cytochrome P450 n=1 Tax=Schistosoma curassoni TaxID=6186 RepID=A0A183KQC1_9TREM|nr:unnamed protein product [Schistosoma curassoni]
MGFVDIMERDAIVETHGPAVTGGAFDTSGTPFSFHAGEGFEEGRFEKDWIVDRFREPWDKVSRNIKYAKDCNTFSRLSVS